MPLLPPAGQRHKIILRLGVCFVCVYLFACAFLYFRQAYLIFIPTTAIESTPEQYGCKFEDVRIRGSNFTLAGWWLPAKDPLNSKLQGKWNLIYFHGNAASIGANTEQICRFSKYGFNVLIVDYRGFGNSVEGPPTETKAYADAEAAYQYLQTRPGVTPQNTVIYGHSLGGAIAIELATHHPDAARLIVESSFTSIVDEAGTEPQYRIFPLRLLVHEKFDSIHKLPLLKMPVFFIHGGADEIIPVEQGIDNFISANEPKSLLIIDGGKHVNCASMAPEKYRDAILLFILTGKSELVKIVF